MGPSQVASTVGVLSGAIPAGISAISNDVETISKDKRADGLGSKMASLISGGKRSFALAAVVLAAGMGLGSGDAHAWDSKNNAGVIASGIVGAINPNVQGATGVVEGAAGAALLMNSANQAGKGNKANAIASAALGTYMIQDSTQPSRSNQGYNNGTYRQNQPMFGGGFGGGGDPRSTMQNLENQERAASNQAVQQCQRVAEMKMNGFNGNYLENAKQGCYDASVRLTQARIAFNDAVPGYLNAGGSPSNQTFGKITQMRMDVNNTISQYSGLNLRSVEEGVQNRMGRAPADLSNPLSTARNADMGQSAMRW